MNTNKYIIILFVIIFCKPVWAEIDKIYHPYVEGYKSEFEYRTLYKNDKSSIRDGTQIHRIAFGHSVTDRFSLEAYIIGKNTPVNSFSIDGYEFEAKYQITEQGEFWSDWGLLFEYDRDTERNITESAMAVLWEKQLNNWIGTVNFFTEYEFGSGIKNEFETALHGQIKYRWSRYLEPAVELYFEEEAHGMGPVFLGTQKIGTNKLKWELGFIFGLNSRTADQNLRFLLDFEF